MTNMPKITEIIEPNDLTKYACLQFVNIIRKQELFSQVLQPIEAR